MPDTPCIHLGDHLYRDGTAIIFECAPFGECTTVGPPHVERAVCGQGCREYFPYDVSSPLAQTPFAARFDLAARSIPEPPKWENDRGIVIVAGGWRFFPSLWVTVKLIRASGCRLPIQVWHLEGELHELMRWFLRDQNVTWVNATRYQEENPQWQFSDPDRGNLGWATKALAIAACPFRHVLSFDADCYPVGNPALIFESAGYRDTGAVFFPDLSGSVMKSHQWLAFGVRPRSEHDWESGQFAVDKSRQWPATWLSFWLNSHSRESYRHVYGDKDTFHVAWRKLDAPVALHPDPAIWRHVAFIQRLPSGQPFSVHRCRDKFRLDEPDSFRTPQWSHKPRFVRALPREHEAHAAFNELRRLYDRPSLLIVGHPRGFTSFTAEAAAKATGLMPHPAGKCEIFNQDHNPNWTHRHCDANATVYPDLIHKFEHWSRSTVLKDVVRPRQVAKYVTEHVGKLRVLYVHRDPVEVRLFQHRQGWHNVPHPAQHVAVLREIADAEVSYEQLCEEPEHLWRALRQLGYQVQPYDYRDENFQKKLNETREKTEQMRFEAEAERMRLKEDVSRRGEYTVICRWFSEHPPSAKVVVDIGANGKDFSNSWNLIADCGWRGVLVEPNPDRAQRLPDDFVGNYSISKKAVSDFSGRGPLYLADNSGQCSMIADWENIDRPNHVDVEVTTLLDVLRDHDVPRRFGVLSVDTEGVDQQVVQPMLEHSDWRADMLIVECIGWEEKRLPWADVLETAGYSLHGRFIDNWFWTFDKTSTLTR